MDLIPRDVRLAMKPSQRLRALEDVLRQVAVAVALSKHHDEFQRTRFDMGLWLASYNAAVQRAALAPDCGTAACICGCLTATFEEVTRVDIDNAVRATGTAVGNVPHTCHLGATILGISGKEACDLFLAVPSDSNPTDANHAANRVATLAAEYEARGE